MGIKPRTGNVVSLVRGKEPLAGDIGACQEKLRGLSFREAQVLEMIAEGHSNKEIAELIFVSPETVKTYISRLYRKLEVSSRMEAIVKAYGLGMIKAPEPSETPQRRIPDLGSKARSDIASLA